MCAVLLMLLLAFAVPVLADDSRRRNVDVDAVIPVPPYEHDRLHYFDGRPHHLVPGTVSINRSPYVCDIDRDRFRNRDDFIAHLRRAHHMAPEDIPPRLVVQDGQVHFLDQ